MSQSVDLCIIAEHFYPVLSGASERFRRYLPGLRERGINVQVFTIWHEGLEHQEMIDGATIRRLVLPPSDLHPSAELAKQTLRYFKATGKWPDVVHVLSHTLQGVPYIWRMRIRRIACINSITMNPFNPSTTLLGKAKFWMHQWLRYGVFNQVIVSSQVVAQAAQRCGIPARRIRIIANGVDTSRFHPIEDAQEKQHLRQEFGFAESDKIVLFVGFISHRKGIDLLLEAWSQVNRVHPQAKLILIGPKEPQAPFTAFFEHKMMSLTSSDITYLEPLEHVEVCMQTADILILPSRLEGMPNVVVEGMACALPCLLTPFEGLPETFGQPGVDYILTTFEPEKIASDINALLADPQRRKAIAQVGLTRARTVLNIQTSLDLHAESYHYWAAKQVAKPKHFS